VPGAECLVDELEISGVELSWNLELMEVAYDGADE
jgi:hypothetical protein